MTMTYSIDLRRLAFIKYQKLGSLRATARAVEVSPSTAHRWKHSTHWGQFVKSKQKRQSCRRKMTASLCELLQAYYDDNCTSSVRWAKQSIGLSVSASTVRRALKSIGLTRKRLSNKVLGHCTPDQVQAFKDEYLSTVKHDTHVVSVDESSFSEKVQPQYGYSQTGRSCTIRNRKGSWTTWTLLMAASSDGDTCHLVKKGAVNKTDFAEFILDLPYPPGTVLLLDNCSIHKNLNDVYNAKGYIPLFLCPYSPQFQPIELGNFTKVKTTISFLLAMEWTRNS